MAVPPPQQKLLDFSPSIVTIGAFQAVNNSVGKLVAFGMSQRIRGGGTVADIVKRSDHAAQPGFSRASVRIDEDECFDVLGQLHHCVNKVVNFFTAAFRPSREKDGCLDARLRSDALYGWSGGIGLRGEYEKNFVILMIEFAQGNEVFARGRVRSRGRDR